MLPTNGAQQAYLLHKRIHGEEHEGRVYDQTLEEAGELIAEIMRANRGRAANVDAETADLFLCLVFLWESRKEHIKPHFDAAVEKLNRALDLLETERFRKAQPSPQTPARWNAIVCKLCGGAAEYSPVEGVWRHAEKPPELIICDRYGYPIEVKPAEPKTHQCKRGCALCDPLAHCRLCGEFMEHGHDCKPVEPAPPAASGSGRMVCALCGGAAKFIAAEDCWRHADEPPTLIICDKYGYPIPVKLVPALATAPPEGLAQAARLVKRYLVEWVPKKDEQHMLRSSEDAYMTITTNGTHNGAFDVRELPPITEAELDRILEIEKCGHIAYHDENPRGNMIDWRRAGLRAVLAYLGLLSPVEGAASGPRGGE